MTCARGSCAYFGGGARSWSATGLLIAMKFRLMFSLKKYASVHFKIRFHTTIRKYRPTSQSQSEEQQGGVFTFFMSQCVRGRS